MSSCRQKVFTSPYKLLQCPLSAGLYLALGTGSVHCLQGCAWHWALGVSILYRAVFGTGHWECPLSAGLCLLLHTAIIYHLQGSAWHKEYGNYSWAEFIVAGTHVYWALIMHQVLNWISKQITLPNFISVLFTSFCVYSPLGGTSTNHLGRGTGVPSQPLVRASLSTQASLPQCSDPTIDSLSLPRTFSWSILLCRDHIQMNAGSSFPLDLHWWSFSISANTTGIPHKLFSLHFLPACRGSQCQFAYDVIICPLDKFHYMLSIANKVLLVADIQCECWPADQGMNVSSVPSLEDMLCCSFLSRRIYEFVYSCHLHWDPERLSLLGWSPHSVASSP